MAEQRNQGRITDAVQEKNAEAGTGLTSLTFSMQESGPAVSGAHNSVGQQAGVHAATAKHKGNHDAGSRLRKDPDPVNLGPQLSLLNLIASQEQSDDPGNTVLEQKSGPILSCDGVRVSNELGAGNPKSAAFSVLVVTLVSLTFAVVEAVIVLSLRDVISYAFTSGETVAKAVSHLTPYLAVTLILNGIQPVLSGVAVGCGWQAFVAYVNVGCYYVVGIPFGCILGFRFDLGAEGIWVGMIGGTLIQTLILLWVTFRTDWNKEVDKAKNRVEKWDDKKQPLLKG